MSCSPNPVPLIIAIDAYLFVVNTFEINCNLLTKQVHLQFIIF